MLVRESWGGTSKPTTITTATEAQSLFRVYALCTKSMCQFWYESLVFPTSNTNTMSIDFLCLRSTAGPRQTSLEERWRRTDFIIILESKRWNGGQPTALCPNESACKYCRGCLAPKWWVARVRWIDDCWEWAEIGIHFLCHLGSRPDCRERFHVEEAGVTVHLKNVTSYCRIWIDGPFGSFSQLDKLCTKLITHIQSGSWNSGFMVCNCNWCMSP